MKNIGVFFSSKAKLIEKTECGPNFELVQSDDRYIVISKDVDPNSGSKKFTIGQKDSLFFQIYGLKKSLYEVVYNEDIPVKAFFDYDRKIEKGKFPIDDFHKDKDAQLTYAMGIVQKIREDFERICPGADSEEVIIFESCTETKISFHIIFPNCIFQNILQHRKFVENMTPIEYLDGLIYTKFRSFRLPYCKKLSAESNYAIKKILYPEWESHSHLQEIFYDSLITNVPNKAEFLSVITKRTAPDQRNKVYPTVDSQETEDIEEEPIIFSKENRFAQVLKCYNLNALPNIHSVDSRLGELLERLPNRGSKSQTQGYEVRDWLKMFCHHWGYQNERMEDAKKEWLTWLSNKDNYSQNEHGYISEWESFCRHCATKKEKSYDLPLEYLLAFVHEVEKKFDAKTKASRKKKKITDSLEEQDEYEEIFNEDSVNFIEHEDEIVEQQEEERPNRPNFLGYPFEEQKLHRPFSLKDLDFHLVKSPRGVIEDSIENIKIVVDYYNLFCAKIRTIGSILFKTINPRSKLVDYKFVKQYPHFDEHIKIHTRDAKGHLRNLSISVGGWISKKAIGGLKAYDNITFDTKLSDSACEITSCFNLFRGFPILKELEEGKYQTSDDKCATILEHIRENICYSRKPEEKKALYDHFRKKLATHLRTPGENKTGILLYGQSGSGKGLTTELVKNLFGASNCQYFVTFDQATDKFNSKLSRCCVAFVDEVHGTKNSSKFSQISHTQTRIGAHMKALISESEIVINPKGVNSYQVPNCIFWFFLTDLLHGLSSFFIIFLIFAKRFGTQ